MKTRRDFMHSPSCGMVRSYLVIFSISILDAKRNDHFVSHHDRSKNAADES